MCARIVQVDLAAPLSPVVSERAETLWLLVRFGVQPLGFVQCDVRAGMTLSPDRIARLIVQTLSLQLHDAARQRSFETRTSERASDAVMLLDDANVDRYFHITLAENFHDTRVQCVIGNIWPSALNGKTQAVFETSVGDFRFHRRVLSPFAWNTMFAPRPSGFEPRISISLRRATFDALGGIDPALGGEAAKYDLITRVLRSGGIVVHDPRAIAFATRYGSATAAEHAAYCAKYFRDVELANLSMRAWRTLLRESLARFDFASAAGALLGTRAYRRARRRLRKAAAAPKVTLKKAA